MKSYLYLLIDFACILIPFIFSFWGRHSFYKKWKYFFPANLLVGIFFIVWDVIFTKNGIWGFNPDYLVGINVFNLPIEEVLFFICIPYACVFTYFAFQYLFPKANDYQWLDFGVYLMVAIAVLFGISGYCNWYTATTGWFTFIFLTLCILTRQPMRLLLLSYLAIIPFFLMSNGILTGSFLPEPVVWYNDLENLGIRFLTIPIEDFLYGFLLISMNIVLMTRFENYFLLKGK